MEPRLLAVATACLPRHRRVASPSPPVAAALREAGYDAVAAGFDELAAAAVDALVLVDGELAAAGRHGEELVARAAALLAPGGSLLVAARSPVRAALGGHPPDGELYDADGLRRLLGHRGFTVELLCAPGAGDLLAGAPTPGYRPDLDRRPGLLDAGDVVVALGHLPADAAGRSAEFFATLPRKVVAAAVVCRDADGRLLTVHDSFKGHWTIPGGVVDAGEDPLAGAVREAWEEAGVRVEADTLLGVFAGRWPDRLLVVYEARPVGEPSPAPAPVHAHEIDAVEWVRMPAALDRLAPHVRSQVTRCLEHPGRTWPPSGRA